MVFTALAYIFCVFAVLEASDGSFGAATFWGLATLWCMIESATYSINRNTQMQIKELKK